MGAARRFTWRSILMRACGVLLTAVLLQYATAWACAAIAAWDNPPTGLTRGTWIASRTRNRTVLKIDGGQSRFELFETRGVLAHSVVLQWAMTTYNVEDPSAVNVSGADLSQHLPGTLRSSDRRAFRVW